MDAGKFVLSSKLPVLSMKTSISLAIELYDMYMTS